MASKTTNTKKLTAIAILSALIIVLQIASSFIKFGAVNITLALTPIIIGAALYGPGCGAFLGFVMGLVVFISGLLGWDGGFVQLLMGENAIMTVLLCLVKSTAGGYVAGLLYKLISDKNKFAATLTAGVALPVVNTGIFVLGMMTIFNPTVQSFAEGSGKSAIAFLLFAMIGINFIIEMVVNIVLSSAVTRIIHVVSRNK